MAEGFKTYKRKEWWREDGEVTDSDRRMKESSKKESYELKKGSDGRNLPSIVTKYAKKSGVQKVAEKKIIARKYEEAFDEEDDFDTGMEDESMADADMDVGMDAGINDEDDVPMEAEDDMGLETGNVCTCPACGAKLVIETVPEDQAEEDGMDDDMGADMDSMESEPEDMSVENDEEEDVPKLEAKKDKFKSYQKKMEAKKNVKSDSEESFEEAYRKWKEDRKRRIEAIKNGSKKKEAKSEIGVEYGSDTKDMTKSGESKTGVKTDVGKGNDDDFGITSSDTGMVGKGQSRSGSKSSISSSGSRTAEKKVSSKKPMEEEEAAVSDPFEDQDDLTGMLDGDDYADIPVDVGADSDQIEHFEAVQKRRKNRGINESTSNNQVFDFKKLVRGDFK